jgi:hypothetical protein
MFCRTEHTETRRPHWTKETPNPTQKRRVEGAERNTNGSLGLLHLETDTTNNLKPMIRERRIRGLEKDIVPIDNNGNTTTNPESRNRPTESEVILKAKKGKRQIRTHHPTPTHLQRILFREKYRTTSPLG